MNLRYTLRSYGAMKCSQTRIYKHCIPTGLMRTRISLRSSFTRIFVVASGLLILAPIVFAAQFSVKEYNEFHEVLHPLEHEALPSKDFQRIRSNAAELVKRGKAIIQVGLPGGMTSQSQEEFRKELKKFESALESFSQHARNGTDTELETSFSEVHDSFEMLVGMLPRK